MSLSSVPGTASRSMPAEPVAETVAGAVRGVSEGGVSRFLGVPYAAAPVGALRFEKPQSHGGWDGVRDATRMGPNAPHQMGAFEALDITPLVGTGWVKGDDFLNVNIWTPEGALPASAAGGAGAGLPVMVFIHGGAFVGGSNHAAVQDGARFAGSGVVCMTITYRMGVEGFLPIPGAPTNLGLRDMIAALAWVRDNAAAFGGDPANVTVFGESAGAMAVADLMASPLAKGLFRRAIIQSGHGEMVRSIETQSRVTKALAKRLKITPDVAGFRTRGVEACLEAMAWVQAPTVRIDLRDAAGREPAYGLSKFLPVYGDDVLPLHPREALAAGAGAEVELLIGANAEEMNLYFAPTGALDRIPGLAAWFILSRVEPKAGRMLKAYGLGAKGRRPGDVLTRAMHDLVFRWPARAFAAAHKGPTHFYEFEWRSPAFNGRLGACHALEIPFVFNTLDCCDGPKGFVGVDPPQALAERIHRLWVRFGTDGVLPWPEYEPAGREVYRLEAGAAARDPEMPAEAFWS